MRMLLFYEVSLTRHRMEKMLSLSPERLKWTTGTHTHTHTHTKCWLQQQLRKKNGGQKHTHFLFQCWLTDSQTLTHGQLSTIYSLNSICPCGPAVYSVKMYFLSVCPEGGNSSSSRCFSPSHGYFHSYESRLKGYKVSYFGQTVKISEEYVILRRRNKTETWDSQSATTCFCRSDLDLGLYNYIWPKTERQGWLTDHTACFIIVIMLRVSVASFSCTSTSISETHTDRHQVQSVAHRS